MKLDILIPVYNTKADHLFESVFSVIRQINKRKHRVILLDDASNEDETLFALDALEKYCKVIHFDSNEGTAAVLNRGHEIVESDWVGIVGSDDVCAPEKFPMQISYLKKNPEVDVLGTNLYAFNDGDIRRRSLFTSDHDENPDLTNEKNWFVNHGTVIYRQEAVMSVGGYNEEYRRRQDIELWLRMAKEGYQFRNVVDCLYAWRRYPNRNPES
jgi:glycosyltransferase involved in cell wall biosynthesis